MNLYNCAFREWLTLQYYIPNLTAAGRQKILKSSAKKTLEIKIWPKMKKYLVLLASNPFFGPKIWLWVPDPSLRVTTKHHSWRNFPRFYMWFTAKNHAHGSVKILCTHIFKHCYIQLKNQHIIGENAIAIWLLRSACNAQYYSKNGKNSAMKKWARITAHYD